MSRLEEKLKELGYRDLYPSIQTIKLFRKTTNGGGIHIYTENNKITSYKLFSKIQIITQQDVDDVQKAFNEMQKDLEVLRNVESEK